MRCQSSVLCPPHELHDNFPHSSQRRSEQQRWHNNSWQWKQRPFAGPSKNSPQPAQVAVMVVICWRPSDPTVRCRWKAREPLVVLPRVTCESLRDDSPSLCSPNPSSCRSIAIPPNRRVSSACQRVDGTGTSRPVCLRISSTNNLAVRKNCIGMRSYTRGTRNSGKKCSSRPLLGSWRNAVHSLRTPRL